MLMRILRSGDGPDSREEDAVDAAVHGDAGVDGGGGAVAVRSLGLLRVGVGMGMGGCVLYRLT